MLIFYLREAIKCEDLQFGLTIGWPEDIRNRIAEANRDPNQLESVGQPHR